MDKHPIQGGVEILLVASCYKNLYKLEPNEPVGSYPDFGHALFITNAYIVAWLTK